MSKHRAIILALAYSLLVAHAHADKESDADKLIDRGDLSPIKAAYEDRDLQMLWHFFGMGVNWQYVGGSTTAEIEKAALTQLQIRQLNRKVELEAAKYLALIPGHAKRLGDRIEIASNTLSPKNERIRFLARLGQLGTPEAIQQIGRFMDDDRNPEVPPNAIQPSDYDLPAPNYSYATAAMHEALKDNSPVKLGPSGYFMGDNYETIQAWWRSDSSLPYRQQLPGVELPENVRHPPSAAEVAAKRKAANDALNAEPPQPLPGYVFVLGLACVAGLTIWLKHHRRSPALRLAKKAVADG